MASSAARFDAGLDAAFADAEFQAALAGLDRHLLFGIGDDRRLVRFAPGGGLVPKASPDGVISASEAVWGEALSPAPRPGFQSFMALRLTNAAFAVEGDDLALAQCLHALERLFELARATPPASAAPVRRDPALICGRYRDVTGAGGATARIYHETAGEGVPLLLLHTAGADSRQFHALMSDVEIAAAFRMHAFDMPLHGRSFPPERWDGGPWRLTQDDYLAWCVAFIRDVVGEPVVLMGCSMGAAITIAMAARHPEHLRAAIALEAPDRSPGRLNPYLAHAQVNQAAYNGSYVRGLMSPASPEAERRLAWWIYGQGGFGVYAGDLRFYSEEYDGTRLASAIDTARTPLALLTGEYDYSASPAATERLAAMIPGAAFRAMPGLGHFPMTENPDLFRAHLMPVLSEVADFRRPDRSRN